MKHGDKAKSKAASKASGKKSIKASAPAKSSGAKVIKASPAIVKGKNQQQASIKTAKQTGSSSKAVASSGNGKPVRIAPDNAGFANAVVGAAFKRAVKKYPNAFRRLTD